MLDCLHVSKCSILRSERAGVHCYTCKIRTPFWRCPNDLRKTVTVQVARLSWVVFYQINALGHVAEGTAAEKNAFIKVVCRLVSQSVGHFLD